MGKPHQADGGPIKKSYEWVKWIVATLIAAGTLWNSYSISGVQSEVAAQRETREERLSWQDYHFAILDRLSDAIAKAEGAKISVLLALVKAIPEPEIKNTFLEVIKSYESSTAQPPQSVEAKGAELSLQLKLIEFTSKLAPADWHNVELGATDFDVFYCRYKSPSNEEVANGFAEILKLAGATGRIRVREAQRELVEKYRVTTPFAIAHDNVSTKIGQAEQTIAIGLKLTADSLLRFISSLPPNGAIPTFNLQSVSPQNATEWYISVWICGDKVHYTN